MSFLIQRIPSSLGRNFGRIFTRGFGVEFKIHSMADGETIDVEADEGTTLLEVCQNEGIDITSVCGGGGSCGSCHIIFPKELFATLPAPKDTEKELLANVVLGVQPTSRLACTSRVDKKFAGKIIEVPMPL